MASCTHSGHDSTCKFARHAEHLLYEIEMLKWGWEWLRDNGSPKPKELRWAVLEATLVHTRIVAAALHMANPRDSPDDIFANTKPAFKKVPARKGLWQGADVLNAGDRSKLKNFDQLNKVLAHLSAKRGPSMTPTDWRSDEWLEPFISPICEVCRHAVSANLECGFPATADAPVKARWDAINKWAVEYQVPVLGDDTSQKKFQYAMSLRSSAPGVTGT